MFYGTTPSVLSQYVKKEIVDINPSKVFVPFAGNFVVEQVVGLVSPEIDIQSTDVSLYSRAIGFGVTDQKFGLKLGDKIGAIFPYMATKTTPLELAAQVIFFADVAQNIKKAHIPYYASLHRDAVTNQEAYFEKIYEKLLRFKEAIKGMTFYGTDACELIPDVKSGDVVFYDPPVLLGDYEKMFAPLEACYTSDPVEYFEMNDELKHEQLQTMREIGATVYYRTNNPLPKEEIPKGFREVYRYQYKNTGNYCLYTNRQKKKVWVGRFNVLKEEVRNYPMHTEKDQITTKSKVNIVRVSANIGNHYRLLWVKKATMSNAGYSFLIFIDQKLIGMVVVDSALAYGTDLAALFSDPAVPFSNYARISKLILHLISTKEFLTMFNNLTMWEHEGFATRVFTNNKVSMKYRGIFEMTKREEDPDSNYKYKLIYQKRKNIKNTYKQALQEWLAKHGENLINEWTPQK